MNIENFMILIIKYNNKKIFEKKWKIKKNKNRKPRKMKKKRTRRVRTSSSEISTANFFFFTPTNKLIYVK